MVVCHRAPAHPITRHLLCGSPQTARPAPSLGPTHPLFQSWHFSHVWVGIYFSPLLFVETENDSSAWITGAPSSPPTPPLLLHHFLNTRACSRACRGGQLGPSIAQRRCLVPHCNACCTGLHGPPASGRGLAWASLVCVREVSSSISSSTDKAMVGLCIGELALCDSKSQRRFPNDSG